LCVHYGDYYHRQSRQVSGPQNAKFKGSKYVSTKTPQYIRARENLGAYSSIPLQTESREQSGVVSCSQKNQVKQNGRSSEWERSGERENINSAQHWVAIPPLTLRSHALVSDWLSCLWCRIQVNHSTCSCFCLWYICRMNQCMTWLILVNN